LSDNRVGYPDRLEIHGLTRIWLFLIGGAFACRCGQRKAARAGEDSGEHKTAAQLRLVAEVKHLGSLLCLLLGRKRNGRSDTKEDRLKPFQTEMPVGFELDSPTLFPAVPALNQ
jgi:hypothetical protein